MITAEIFEELENRIVIDSDLWMRDKDRISQCSGSKFSIKHKKWLMPLSWGSCKVLRGVFGDELIIGDKLKEWSWNEYNDRILPCVTSRKSLNTNDIDENDEVLKKIIEGDVENNLYDYQKAGIYFLTKARRALLLDEMGTGKTRQTIETLKTIKALGDIVFPAIIVCPKNVMISWKNEFNRWFPEAKVEVCTGSRKDKLTAIKKISNQESEVLIINYESVRSFSRLAPYGSIKLKRCYKCDKNLQETKENSPAKCEKCKKELNEISWKSIVVDESHRIKNPTAKQTRSVWALRTGFETSIYCLTGTAIANAPDDLWPSLHLIAPEDWYSRRAFIDRYCDLAYSPWGPMEVIGLKNVTKEEFFSILEPRMRRTPKKAVLSSLPDKTYVKKYIEMPAKQLKPYKQMASSMIAQLDGDDGLVVASNGLTMLTRLTQFASAVCEIDETGEIQYKNSSNKVDALVDLIEDMDGKSLVVFAVHRKLIDLAAKVLTKHKISYSLIVGGQNTYDRQNNIDDFQKGKTQVILCTMSAGNVGVTLTRADTLVFMQRSWSIIDNSQAEDRIHRIGAEKHENITIIDLISQDTFEEEQLDVLEEKKERAEEVLRDRDFLRRLLSGN